MADHPYLSIGEVLGLLLEDFPDVTISKIRFLESQGLIEPERTPSGYRKFYEHDVELLRTILHEQKANFLPLKVIRDRIESGAIDADVTGRTPPGGIRNVDDTQAAEARRDESRDSVFRRTDGGPEWVEGQPLIPGETEHLPSPITAAVPVVSGTPLPPPPPPPPVAAAPSEGPAVVAALIEPPPEATKPTDRKPRDKERDKPMDKEREQNKGKETDKGQDRPAKPARTAPAATETLGLPYSRDELCSGAGITLAQLAQLEEFGIVSGRGSGKDTSFPVDSVEIARIAGAFLEQGIDARHLRGWRQSAEREAALFEQRIMPLLRQRNPQSRQQALDTLGEMAELGGRLRSALIASSLKHHFEA